MSQPRVRHILSLSGGKDSTALAIYMRDRVPEMEYVFCDTGEELPETYAYLRKIEAFLGKNITVLNPDRPFSHYLDIYRGVLPDAKTRWCTRMLKIKPFERYVGNDLVFSYIAIRADEVHRKGYISSKSNITPVYPFIDDGITKTDVYRILEESGIGFPDYYKWRSRSGCYFCFFQRRIEWVGLLENHPDLFDKARGFEKFDPETGERFTWNQRESLDELSRPERMEEIKASRQNCLKNEEKKGLIDIFFEDNNDDDQPCLICHL
ncbi:phosphoadenosine phosphosulfate reductase family protein [Kallotenue papyrolyticum]|uniref:phosphoadenosine phosphosulfate reductase family protein n=1 Tax=Kallotenue papyrolyticum TaxID=1325125 RepID=UPI0004AD567F|nr:phosphoadenosine phosphosulfate reductase family protein [Kallotenue papyrolyticum]